MRGVRSSPPLVMGVLAFGFLALVSMGDLAAGTRDRSDQEGKGPAGARSGGEGAAGKAGGALGTGGGLPG